MTPRQVLEEWIEPFNYADAVTIANLYTDNALNHQVANEPEKGIGAIRHMSTREFENAENDLHS